MSKRVNLVTGGGGFSGSHLVKLLLERGEKVIVSDLPSALDSDRTRLIFSHIGLDLDHPNIEVIPADLTRPESLEPLFQKPVTHLFHTASLYDYSAPLERLRRINIDGTNNLLELACGAGLTQFIHWSTCGVFGSPHPATYGEHCNLPFTEERSSPKNSSFHQDGPEGTPLVNDYSITKWKQEQFAWRCHRERGLPLTVVRPGPLYGPGSDYGHGGIILTIHKGYLPFIPADAKNYVTVSLHVEDMARFTDFISRRPDAIGEDFNVVDDSIISQYDFLRYITLLLGRRVYSLPITLIDLKRIRPLAIAAAKAWLYLEQKWGIPRVQVFEVQSAEYFGKSYWISNKKTKDWGYSYRYPDVREGLRDTIDWFRKVGWLP